MGGYRTRMVHNYNYELATILISIMILIYSRKREINISFQNKLFVAVVISNLITALSNVVNNFTIFYNAPVWIDYACSTIYFLSHILVVPLMYAYVLSIGNEKRNTPVILKVLTYLPCAFAYILVLTNPFTKYIFYYTREGAYQRSNGLLLLYFVVVFYVLIILYEITRYRRRYSSGQRVVLYVSVFISVMCMLLQHYRSYDTAESFGIAFSCIMIFYYIQDPRKFIDETTRFYNSDMFRKVQERNILFRRTYDLILVDVNNYELDKKHSLEADDSAVLTIGRFLHQECENAYIYRLDKKLFAIELDDSSDDEVTRIMEDIEDRFTRPWKTLYDERLYRLKMCHLMVPTDVDSFHIINGITEAIHTIETEKTVLGVEDFDLTMLARSDRIKDIISEAIEKESFEMVYSPIYSINSKKIVAAEVTSRFYSDELGYVREQEVSECVEKNGQMIGLSRSLFDNVCRFIETNNIEKLGMSFIGIKLRSPICLQYDFVKNIKEIFGKYHFSPSLICFQISEYTVSILDKTFEDNMRILTDMGFRFCLDDYGSGYTNLASIYELPLNVIKLESHVVRSANDNCKAKITLKSTLELAKSLNMTTIMGGISEEDEYNMINNLSCDYAIGSYFYDEVDGNRLLSLVMEGGEA